MRRELFNLMQAGRGRGTKAAGARLRAETTGDDTATVYIYDAIDSWFGVSASDFTGALAAIDAANVVLRINSPGGDVFEARAMMAAIAEHPATFTARIDGLCASAATALTLPCDSVEIVEGGFYMIHQAWSVAIGNADDMRQTADLLDKVDAVIVAGYVAKSGKSADEVKALMAAETWYEAEEAVAAGFCDTVLPLPTGGKAKARTDAGAFNLSAFANAPKALLEPAATSEPDPEILQRNRAHMLTRLSLYERTAG